MASRTSKLTVRHQWPDGGETVYEFTQDGDGGALHVRMDGVWTTPPAAATGILDAAVGDALYVGRGVTTIEAVALDENDLLTRLTFGEECDGDDWEEWIGDSELDARLKGLSGGFRVGRWRVRIGHGLTRILTNGTRSLALTWPDSDTPEPTSWEPMFEWSFGNESGGPCIWDGACVAGLVAPDVLMEIERGDQDPGIRLTVFDPPSVQEVITTAAEHWAFPLLLTSSGLPGLTQPERDAVWGASVDNFQEFRLTCPEGLRTEVTQNLLDTVPGLEDAEEALRDPDSTRGKAVYDWLRGLAGSLKIHEPVDWFTIFSSLKGEIDGPTPLTNAELEAKAARPRRATEKAQQRKFDELRSRVTKALEGVDPDWKVDMLQGKLSDLPRLRATSEAARALFGLEPGQAVLEKHALERLKQKPGDESWESETWAAFWAIQKTPSDAADEELRLKLAKAEESREVLRAQQLSAQRHAEKRGWPGSWPWELCELWLNEGGTPRSARAWAEAGYTATEVILGDPPALEAMDGLRARLRKRNPPHRDGEEGKLTRVEADLALAAHYRAVEEGWDRLASVGLAISAARGLEPTAVAFESYLADGERFGIKNEDFVCKLTSGEEVTVSIEDSSETREMVLWSELESAVETLAGFIPPVIEGRIESAADLMGEDHDVRMCLFADYDGDGHFQYDEKGLKTIISGVWL